ncbi:MAG: hypothetical protein R3B96_05585 [Pirellulaceae bacterium]|nr:hypothetical protein [Planctomycetales bacterium]
MSYQDTDLLPLLERDRRYPMEAYRFIYDALKFAQEDLHMGADEESEDREEQDLTERHLTGQDLCEAIRRYSLQQYGYMAKVVLNRLGMHCTRDFGNVVYNLIGIGMMRKSRQDRREHFDDVYDFEIVFRQEYRFEVRD